VAGSKVQHHVAITKKIQTQQPVELGIMRQVVCDNGKRFSGKTQRLQSGDDDKADRFNARDGCKRRRVLCLKRIVPRSQQGVGSDQGVRGPGVEHEINNDRPLRTDKDRFDNDAPR